MNDASPGRGSGNPLPAACRRELQGMTAGAFTMLEVLVAVAIFAIAVVALAGAYVDILNSVERVKVDQSLENELAHVRARILLEPDLDAIEQGGEVATATQGVAAWSATVEATSIADLFRVTLEIHFEGDGESVAESATKQTLYVLRPDWSDPTEREDLRAERRRQIEEAKRSRPL